MTEVNPTTLRFSRRMGEALRGSDYARSVEPPPHGTGRFDRRLATVLIAVSLLIALVLLG